MPTTPYYETPYDNSRRVARLSDLARMRADAQAQTQAQMGANNANLLANLGQVAAGTVANVAATRAAERERASAKGETQARKDTLRMIAALPAEQQAPELRAAGYFEDADRAEARAQRLADRADDNKRGVLADFRARLNSAKTVFGQAAVLGQTAQERPELWGEIRPQLVDLASQLDPKLAEFVPQAYEPTAVNEMVSSVSQMAESYAKADAAARHADAALTKGKNMAAVTKEFAALFQQLPPDARDAAHAQFVSVGVPEAVLTAAREAQAAPQKPSSDWGAYLQRVEQGLGRPLSAAEMRVERTRWQAAGNTSTPAATGRRDDPSLPMGVRDYLATFPDKYRGDFNQAEAALNREFAQQQAVHRQLDPGKARAYLRDLFGMQEPLRERPDPLDGLRPGGETPAPRIAAGYAPPKDMRARTADTQAMPAPQPAGPGGPPPSPLGGTALGGTPSASAQPAFVKMRAPTGEIGMVPIHQVEAAKRAGAVVVP